MATITRRTWQTSAGEQREAWQLTFTDQAGQRIRKQFEKKKDADAYRVRARGQVAVGTFTAESTSKTIGEAAKAWLKRGEARSSSRRRSRSTRSMSGSSAP